MEEEKQTEVKYNIGDEIFFVESSTNYGKSVPCPMCFGQRFVTIILGDNSKEKIECGYCGHGIERPSGRAKIWEPHAVVHKGKIDGISTRNGLRYEVGYRTLEPKDVFRNNGDAYAERDRRYKNEVERSKRWFEESFRSAKKRQVWSAGYHRNCIKKAKREIEWHELRLQRIKERAGE